MVELLAGWHGGFGRHRAASIFGAIPHCIMWNSQTFEGEEQSIIELKCIFLLSLFNWMTALRGFAIPSLLDFLDLYSSGQLFFYTKNGLKKNQITS